MLLLPELAPSSSGKMYVGVEPGCCAKVTVPPLLELLAEAWFTKLVDNDAVTARAAATNHQRLLVRIRFTLITAP